MSAVESTERPTHLTPTTSPPPPSSPSDTDSPRSGTGTEPGQGHSDGQEQSDEQSGNQEEERLLRGLGVGLGTVIVVVFVLCVVVVVGIFYFSKRTRRKIDQVNRTTSETPLRSLSTPTSPRSPSSTSSPSPPTHTKESNALSLVATPKSLLPCNESDHKERGGEETGNVSGEDGDSRQVLEQNAAKSGDHGNEEQVSPGVGEE